VTLKSWLQVTQGPSNWYHSKAWVWFSVYYFDRFDEDIDAGILKRILEP